MTAATTRRAAVVINPAKVTDLAARRQEIVTALAAVGYPEPLWLETTPEDPGIGQTKEAVAAGVDTVFACGGDGTVMACITGLAGSSAALAIIPSGTGNLLAGNLGLPHDAARAIELAVHGERRHIDVGSCGATRFAVMAGIGFDAQMLASTDESTKAKIGWPAYLLAALKHLRERPMRVRLRLDNGPVLRRRARTVLIANVGKLTGGINLLPDAKPDDGLFDIAVISPRTVRHWLALGWGVLARRPSPRLLETFRAARVDLHTDRDEPWELDGDVLGSTRDLSVWIEPAALLICLPLRDAEPDAAAALGSMEPGVTA